MDFTALLKLNEDLRSNSPSNTILHYYCRPRIPISNFNTEQCYKDMLNRTPSDRLSILGFAPIDTGVFKLRYDFVANDNVAYEILIKENPPIEDIERLSYLKAAWSALFPLKLFLMDHPKLAKVYRGLLPMGTQITAYFQENFGKKLVEDFKDHIYVRNFTNYYSDLLGIPTIILNNMMWLEGKKEK